MTLMDTNAINDIFKQVNQKMIDPLVKPSGSTSAPPVPSLIGHLLVGAIVGGIVSFLVGTFLVKIGISRKTAGSIATAIFGIVLAMSLLQCLKTL